MFLQWNDSLWFSARSLAYLVSGSLPTKQCQYGFYLMKLSLKNQILISYSHKLCTMVEPVYAAGRPLLQLKGFVASWCLPFCFDGVQNAFQYQEHQTVEVKTIGRQHHLNCSMLSSAMGFSPQFVESILQSWQQSQVFRNSYWTPMTYNLIRCNPVLSLEASFGDKECPVGCSVPHYLAILLH